MRKRNIKTVAHWVIMSILLLFPILMVGVSSFANDEQSVTVTETYEYETNVVNDTSDLVVGNIYHLVNYNEDQTTFTSVVIDDGIFETYAYNVIFDYTLLVDTYIDDNYIDYNDENNIYEFTGTYIYQKVSHKLENNTYNTILICYDSQNSNFLISCDFVLTQRIYDAIIDTDYFNYYSPWIFESDYLGQVTTNVDIQNATYKQEVNNWCNGFKNLPVNQWYGQLLNVIGVGQTTNSVMNVIYVYPLYVLWVYLIDLIVDCLLVIIHFGHNALSRLGGDND